MLILGVILLILGFIFAIPVLWVIGIVLAVIGAVFWIAEAGGSAWGRRRY